MFNLYVVIRWITSRSSGIGIKTAAQLISEYGSLESLLSRTNEIKQPKRREALETNAELARISKRLVTLMNDVPVTVPVEDLIPTELFSLTLKVFWKRKDLNHWWLVCLFANNNGQASIPATTPGNIIIISILYT